MIFEYFCLTDPGLIRDNNEDSVSLDPENQIAVLADGMGGYNAGEVASAMATSFIRTELGRWMSEGGHEASGRELKRAMEICIDNANRSIFNAANSNPQYSGMGTTLVMGVFHGERAMIGHVGDSRCYRLREGNFMQITRDHSLLQEQIDAGLLTPEEALTAPNRNLVTRALGVEAVVNVELHGHAISPGDLYLLCSDGLTDMLRDDEIAAVLYEGRDLAEMADSLIETANLHGGRDNISVVLVRSQDGASGAG